MIYAWITVQPLTPQTVRKKAKIEKKNPAEAPSKQGEYSARLLCGTMALILHTRINIRYQKPTFSSRKGSISACLRQLATKPQCSTDTADN